MSEMNDTRASGVDPGRRVILAGIAHDEDRDYEAELTGWLKDQPQEVWLAIARLADWHYIPDVSAWMIDQPECDRAVAAFILWRSNVADQLRASTCLPGFVLHTVLSNYRKGYYRRCELALDPGEVALAAHAYAEALEELTGPPIFLVPKPLIGPFPATGMHAPLVPSKTEDLIETTCEDCGTGSRIAVSALVDLMRLKALESGIDLPIPEPPETPEQLAILQESLIDRDYVWRIYGTPEVYMAAERLHAERLARERADVAEREEGRRDPPWLWAVFCIVSVISALHYLLS